MAQKFKSPVQFDSTVKVSGEAASRAVQTDGSGNITSSTVTSTELGYLSGVTSGIQTQIGNKISSSEKGAANGVCPLDSGSKIDASYLPNSVMEFKGAYNATTNSPSLVDGTGNAGDFYRVTVAGSQDFGSGSITFVVGDYVMYSGTVWQKGHSGGDAVDSVNGATGVVTVNAINQLTGDVTTSAASGSQSLAATIAAGAVTASKLGTVTDGITLDQSGAGSTLEIKTGGIANAQISGSAAIAYSKLNLSGSIVNADVATGAAIARSKVASGTANRILVNDGSGNLSEAAALTNGQLLIGSTGAAPSAATLTQGSGITITNGAGTITIAATNLGSAGDISETSFSAANNQGTAANVTGLAFANGTVRSFKALVSVYIDATTPLYETFELHGIQKGASWDMSVNSTGDASNIVFSISTAGQVKYTSGNEAGFVSNTMKFRAITTSV